MEWNLNTIIATFAVLVAAIAVLQRLLDKSLSTREHEVYKEANDARLDGIQKRQDERLIIREFQDWVLQFRHDIDRVEEAIKVLDQNKPTTGELDRAAQALEARMVRIEEIVQHLIVNNVGRHAEGS